MPRTRYLNKKSLADTLALFVDGLTLPEPPPEVVPVEDSLHRITAEPILARISAPHYHGAAMDGIAVRAADTFGASDARPVELALAETAKLTTPFPEPLFPEVIVIQLALLMAVQSHPPAVDTPTLPAPPEPLKYWVTVKLHVGVLPV